MKREPKTKELKYAERVDVSEIAEEKKRNRKEIRIKDRV